MPTGEIEANKPTQYIEAFQREAVKQYIVYDGSNRMSEVYEALTEAEDGSPCLKTVYVYDGGSTRIIKMKESLSTWDSSWDV